MLSSIFFVQNSGFRDHSLKSAYAADPLTVAYLRGEYRLTKGFLQDGLLYCSAVILGLWCMCMFLRIRTSNGLTFGNGMTFPSLVIWGRDKTYAAIARKIYWPSMQPFYLLHVSTRRCQHL